MRARVIGAEHASGDVIVVLDAHCECVVNWLPPLLTRIKVNRYLKFIFLIITKENGQKPKWIYKIKSRKTLAVPIVDGIKWNNLEHTGYNDDTKSVGIFEWGFLYKEMKMSESDFSKKNYASEPNP